MARLLRVEYPGAIYHVTSRMVGDACGWDDEGGWPAEKRLFRDDRDQWRFLDRLAERVEMYEIRLYLFACMTNHFHLVFETPHGNCGRFMQSLSTAYTVYYNRRHRRHGPLFDGRYKARLVDDRSESPDLGVGRSYLLSLSRYVHLNPVHVGRFKDRSLEERIAALHAYRWSSYLSYIGVRKPLEWVDYAPVLGQMTGRKRERPERYREFVESGLAESDETFMAALQRSRHAIGGDEFRLRVDDLYREKLANCRQPEDAAFRRVGVRLPVDQILGTVAAVLGVDVDEFKRPRKLSPLRAVAARSLIRYGGLTQRAAAAELNCTTGAAVSVQLAQLARRLEADEGLRRQVQRVDSRLRSKLAPQASSDGRSL